MRHAITIETWQRAYSMDVSHGGMASLYTPLLFWFFGQKTHHFCGLCQNTQLIKPSMSVKYEENSSAAFLATCQYVPHLKLLCMGTKFTFPAGHATKCKDY